MVPTAATAAPRDDADVDGSTAAEDGFVAVYDANFPFVWRSVQRLGVRAAHADDAVPCSLLVVTARWSSARYSPAGRRRSSP